MEPTLAELVEQRLGDKYTVYDLESGYGVEIMDAGPEGYHEWSIVALASWGQDGSAALVMVTTAIDGGWAGLKSPVICSDNKTEDFSDVTLATRIANEVKEFFKVTLPKASNPKRKR